MNRFGDYEVLTALASGGMGGVYLARHAATGDRVALKVLDPLFAREPDLVRRLYAELRVSARASHPGLVAIRAADKSSDDVPFLVMEYLDGPALAAIAGELPLATQLAIGAQIAAALAALHQVGIVHCDVKPENVVVLDHSPHCLRQCCALHVRGACGCGRWSGWPRIKVIDFGVARAADDEVDDTLVAGTPMYMAPEQWHGRPVPASDVYALGCVLYELVTGTPPFEGSLGQLMIAHAERRPSRPSWVAREPISIDLERLILRALAKEPELRPTMAELATELDALADAELPGRTLRLSA